MMESINFGIILAIAVNKESVLLTIAIKAFRYEVGNSNACSTTIVIEF